MAGTHATIGTDLGKIIRIYKVLETIVNGGAAVSIDALDQLETEVESTFMGSDTQRNIVGMSLITELRRVKSQLDTARRRIIAGPLRNYAFGILKPDINSTGRSVRDILFDLTEEMRDDSEEVLENSMTFGSPTADGDNTGDGSIVFYGKNPIDKRDEERIQSQDLLLQCTQDNRQNGVTAGQEVFEVQGKRGVLGTVPVKHAEGENANRLDNGSLDDWTGAAPDSWTVTTDNSLAEETTTVYRSGGSALIATADGSATAFDIEQAETAFINYSSRKLQPLKPYLVSFYARRGAGADIDGTFTVQMKGTGYSPAASEKAAITTLTTSYALQQFVFLAPKDIPTDFALQMIWNGTPTSGRILYVDDVVLQEMTEFDDDGFFLGAIRGATDFIAGPEQADAFTIALTNDWAGLWQTFLSRLTDREDPDAPVHADIGLAFPSASSASANYQESDAQ